MEEWFIVVTNAFRRKEPLPNLIIIDGGKGQLSSVKSLDALELRGKLQYNRYCKTIGRTFILRFGSTIFDKKKSETLKVIQQLRNEAHRFGIDTSQR
jgi:excinuclease ABC subunit C